METNDKILGIKPLLDEINVGSNGIDIIKSSINILHRGSPTVLAEVFARLDNVISTSDDLAWLILMIDRAKQDTDRKIKDIKDPEFTILVRSGRPSTAAIESEIRMMHKDLLDLECKFEKLRYLQDYLYHIEKGLDRCIFVLRDKISYLK